MTEDAAACKAILRAWRADPAYSFPPPYDRYDDLLRVLDRDPAAARLVDGIVVRIGRGDSPGDIDAWMRQFAARRGINLDEYSPPRRPAQD